MDGGRQGAFSIDTIDAPGLCSGADRPARIRIGDFSERLCLDLSHWSVADYEAHWLRGVRSIISGTADACPLVTAMRHPVKARFVLRWLLYRDEEDVRVYQQMVFRKRWRWSMDLASTVDEVPAESWLAEDGEPVSVWHTTIDALVSFEADLRARLDPSVPPPGFSGAGRLGTEPTCDPAPPWPPS